MQQTKCDTMKFQANNENRNFYSLSPILVEVYWFLFCGRYFRGYVDPIINP